VDADLAKGVDHVGPPVHDEELHQLECEEARRDDEVAAEVDVDVEVGQPPGQLAPASGQPTKNRVATTAMKVKAGHQYRSHECM
jgi:hypothetical protein